jgi:hypothetical protein
VNVVPSGSSDGGVPEQAIASGRGQSDPRGIGGICRRWHVGQRKQRHQLDLSIVIL